jgi:Ca2+-binding EF-hand superfamily protein
MIFIDLISRYDVNNDKKLDLDELKVMMEKLQVPQTHLGLKEMIRQVDEDQDNKINFKEVCRFF